MLNFDFTSKRILVVGGSRGIGRGVVENFISLGAKVFYAARNSIVEEVDAQFIKVDLNYESQIKDLFVEIDKSGKIDVLVNTAAINYCNKFNEISIEEWDRVDRVNLRAAFILCKHAALRMKKQGYGKIVNVSSIAGRHRSIVSGAHYVSTKAGMIGLTKQLAYELGPYNINVNVVCPSQTMSEMLEASMSPNELKKLSDNIPLRRIAEVEEQVGPIVFLCSDLSSYMTGAVVDVNGGQI
jgi:3-oxoacyl-[acyl-carrier protein] reductase